MPERAEIEAVAAELKHNDECGSGPVSESEYRADAEAIIRALDRVRDARGGDEAAWRGEEHQWDQGSSGVGEPARSPQGEGHERGIQVAAEELARWRPVNDTAMVARAVVDAYLSCVSSSRDGTVAVEDVIAKLNEMALVDDTRDPHDEGYMAAVFEIREFLAEFGSARAGESKQNADGG